LYFILNCNSDGLGQCKSDERTQGRRTSNASAFRVLRPAETDQHVKQKRGSQPLTTTEVDVEGATSSVHNREKEKATESGHSRSEQQRVGEKAAAARVTAAARVGGSSSGGLSVLIESASEEMDLSTTRES
jgi:hypothetical protein